MEIDKIYQGDCLEIMKDFPDKEWINPKGAETKKKNWHWYYFNGEYLVIDKQMDNHLKVRHPYPDEKFLYNIKPKDVMFRGLHDFVNGSVKPKEACMKKVVMHKLQKRILENALNKPVIRVDEMREVSKKEFNILKNLVRKRGIITPDYWEHQWINIKTKEANMKQASIFAEPIFKGDVCTGYTITGWKNILKHNELPQEYMLSDPHFYTNVNDDTGIEIIYTRQPSGSIQGTYIEKGQVVSVEHWEWIYALLKQAGHNLGEILKEKNKPRVIEFTI